jgi:hypothetical protein
MYDTLLLLHVLAAFALVAGVVCFAALVLSPAGESARETLATPAIALWNVGGIGVLVLGIWLALDVDAYEIWDGWIVAAIVLWFIASAAGGPLSRGIREGGLAAGRARLLLGVAAGSTLLLLLDMVFKPGA